MPGANRRLVLAVTGELAVNLLVLPQLEGLRQAGWQVHIVCRPGPLAPEVFALAHEVHFVQMSRAISPARDVVSIAGMARVLRRIRPVAVVGSTPKAALISMIAARIERIPVRVFQIRGAKWDGTSDRSATLTRLADRVAARAATDVLAVSNSLADLVVSAGVTQERPVVLGRGGSKGVDTGTFFPQPDHRLDPAAPVLGFAGRLSIDKGVEQLLDAVEGLRVEVPGASMQIVGEVDEAQPIPEALVRRLREDAGIDWVGPLTPRDLAARMRNWDLLLFPSHREGLPNVVIEAGASGVPTVAWDVTGVRDAVDDPAGGRLVPLGDLEAMVVAVRECLEPQVHQRMSEHVAAWTRAGFESSVLTGEFSAFLVEACRRRAVASRGDTFYLRRGKRLIDIVGSGAAMLVLSPLLAATAVAIRVKLGRPVLFIQDRGGLDGSVFRLLKFRTLNDDRDEAGNALSDAERLTPFGSRLRSLSIDELPGLVNILRGEMSLVGPRPLMAIYLPRYDEQQARRHEVRPGLTGWTQVNGRNLLDWESKFELDTWYVDHVSFRLDARIVWRTVTTVLHGRGVTATGHVTNAEFMGTPPVVTGSDEPALPQP